MGNTSINTKTRFLTTIILHENKIFDYTKLTNKHFTNPIQTSPTPNLAQRYL